MFKFLLNKWKMWKLTRKWLDVEYFEGDTLVIMKYCPGRQLYKFSPGATVVQLKRLEDGSWYRLHLNEWRGSRVSRQTVFERVYQRYLSELQEISML